MKRNKKILLFPGAFNPPHIGHVEIVKVAIIEGCFDEVWIIPSGNRKDKEILTDYDNRRDMGELFANYLQQEIGLPVKLLTDELDSQDDEHTEQILKRIKSRKDIEMVQLIGSDGIAKLYEHDCSVLNNEKFIVIERLNSPLPKEFPLKKVTFLEKKVDEDISSTNIRNMIKSNNAAYMNFLPKTIAMYIKQHKLYE